MEQENLSTEELEALNALDNQTRQAPGADAEVDQSELYAEQDRDLSAADDEWDEGRYPFEITELKLKKSKKAPSFWRYLELTLTGMAGRKKDRKFFDRVMIEGDKDNATGRLVVLGKATDMYDPESKKFIGRYIDLVGKCVWADIVKKKDSYQGEERERASVAFRGYHHFSKFVLPDENDAFADEGDVLEVLDTPLAELAPEVQDTYVLEDGPQGEVQEVVEYEQEAPFVDELETLPVEETVEEPAPAPAPAPRAAAPRAAAPRPAATPAAAVRPAQAGTKPPF